MSNKRCGIDLGTTYSAISWYDDDNQRLVTVELNSEDGARMIPSVVYYPGADKEALVGGYAVNVKKQFPDRVAAEAKRAMGDPQWRFRVDGKEYSAQQVSAEILKVLIREAKQYISEEDITDFVITVPAYFEEPQKNATLEAGVLAGIPRDHISLLEEPQAAALAYCIEKAVQIDDKYLLVYDLGGGTFDVVLVHAIAKNQDGSKKLTIETLAVDGNRTLGGLDWNKRLADLVVRKIQQAHGISVRSDPLDAAILEENVEKGKRYLSGTSPVKIIGDRVPHEAEVSQTEFEDETAGLLEETRAKMLAVLQDAEDRLKIPREKIDILLSGGSTRMPMCRTMIKATTGKDPLQYKNPDFLVSMGAAYWAYLKPEEKDTIGLASAQPTITIRGTDKDGNPTKVEVGITEKPTGLTCYAVGVEVMDPDSRKRYNSIVLPVNSKLGVGGDVERVYYTTDDGMTEIRVVLTKSTKETTDLKDAPELKTFIVGPLPASAKKGDEVKLKLGHDDNGVICGEAEHTPTNTKIPIRVEKDIITRVP